MADGQITETQVQEVLAKFADPETGRSITQLEQVHDLKLDGDKLSVTLGLTTWAAPHWEQIRSELADLLKKQLPPLDVSVELAEHQRSPEKLGEIGLAAKSVIAVGSGKGGVGKSSVAACLALGLSKAGCKVGLVDADVYGPSIPHMVGAKSRPMMVGERIQPVEFGALKLMSMGFLVPPDQAVLWRGPMLHGAITQFLRDTEWGELDYLIVDMPPGTGDVALSLSQLLPITGAVVVSTPQDVALLDVVKAIAMFRKVNIDVLGMVENMSYFLCPDCDSRHDIFGSGGAAKRAAELEVPFLGEVPINMQIRQLGDDGQIAEVLEREATQSHFEAICRTLVGNLIESHRQKPEMPNLPVLGG